MQVHAICFKIITSFILLVDLYVFYADRTMSDELANRLIISIIFIKRSLSVYSQLNEICLRKFNEKKYEKIINFSFK